MSADFAAFRDAAALRIPGFPAGADPSLDITRQGPLDHVQRVLLRAYALDSSPYLAAGACDAAATLGELWTIWRSASGDDVEGGQWSATTWCTNRVQLVTLEARHYADLYRAATDPIDGYRWRWRGRTPSPEEFQQTLFAGVKTQFAIESRPGGDLVGLVVAYDEDPACRHCFVGFQRVGPRDVSPGGMIEGMGLFLSFLFRSFPYDRLLFDLPEYNLPLLEGCAGTLLSVEGSIPDYFTHAGRQWDRCFVSFHRTAWEPLAEAVFGQELSLAGSGVHRGDA